MRKNGARAILAILLLVTIIPLISFYFDSDNNTPMDKQISENEELVPEDDPLFSEDQAIELVLDKLPGAGYDNILEFSSSYQEGGWVYEGTIQGKKAEYVYQVDGNTGTLLKWQVKKKIK